MRLKRQNKCFCGTIISTVPSKTTVRPTAIAYGMSLATCSTHSSRTVSLIWNWAFIHKNNHYQFYKLPKMFIGRHKQSSKIVAIVLFRHNIRCKLYYDKEAHVQKMTVRDFVYVAQSNVDINGKKTPVEKFRLMGPCILRKV